MRFFEKKSALKLEGLDSGLFEELKTFSVAAPEHISGSFIQKELGYRVLAYSLVVCFLSGVVAWW